MSAVPLEVALQRSRQRLQGNLGIVRHVRRILNGPGMPRIHSASSIINSIATYNHSEMVGHTGAVGFTWEQAAIGAVGECLERYCCAVYNHADLRYASARELGPGAVGMDRFELYTERQQAHPQFPFPRWHADLPIHWVPGRSLLDGGDRWVPASLTYIPYVPSNQPGRQADLLALAVSSGQACHTDPDAALLSGLCEVIERDAFMLVWSKKLSVPRLDVSGDAELSALFDRYFACPGLAFHLFDLTLDVPVPTVLCIAEGQSARGPYLCVGAACRPNYRDAVVKAWMEAAQGLIWAHSLIDSKPDWRPEPDFLNVRDFEDHVRLYCEPEMRRECDFLLDATDTVVPDFDAHAFDGRRGLDHCLEALRPTGMDVIAVDLTTADVAESGFVVPKVFVPGMASLYAVHALPSFGCRRFDSVPQALGLGGLPPGEFNLAPHPFP